MIRRFEVKMVKGLFQELRSVATGINIGDYVLLKRSGTVLVAANINTNSPCLVFLHEPWANAATLASRGLKLVHGDQYKFIFESESFISAASILECTDEGLLDVFYGLANHVLVQAESSVKNYSDRKVLYEELHQWRELLSNATGLQREGIIGLWGELHFVIRSRYINPSYKSWIGYTGSRIDFLSNGIAIECKTSVQGHSHIFSHEQITNPAGNHDTMICSQWIAPDPISGVSLYELVETIEKGIDEPAAFHANLLKVGYIHADRHLYEERFLQLDNAILAACRIENPGRAMEAV